MKYKLTERFLIWLYKATAKQGLRYLTKILVNGDNEYKQLKYTAKLSRCQSLMTRMEQTKAIQKYLQEEQKDEQTTKRKQPRKTNRSPRASTGGRVRRTTPKKPKKSKQ